MAGNTITSSGAADIAIAARKRSRGRRAPDRDDGVEGPTTRVRTSEGSSPATSSESMKKRYSLPGSTSSIAPRRHRACRPKPRRIRQQVASIPIRSGRCWNPCAPARRRPESGRSPASTDFAIPAVAMRKALIRRALPLAQRFVSEIAEISRNPEAPCPRITSGGGRGVAPLARGGQRGSASASECGRDQEQRGADQKRRYREADPWRRSRLSQFPPPYSLDHRKRACRGGMGESGIQSGRASQLLVRRAPYFEHRHAREGPQEAVGVEAGSHLLAKDVEVARDQGRRVYEKSRPGQRDHRAHPSAFKQRAERHQHRNRRHQEPRPPAPSSPPSVPHRVDPEIAGSDSQNHENVWVSKPPAAETGDGKDGGAVPDEAATRTRQQPHHAAWNVAKPEMVWLAKGGRRGEPVLVVEKIEPQPRRGANQGKHDRAGAPPLEGGVKREQGTQDDGGWFGEHAHARYCARSDAGGGRLQLRGDSPQRERRDKRLGEVVAGLDERDRAEGEADRGRDRRGYSRLHTE